MTAQPTHCHFNGTILPIEQAHVSVLARGFALVRDQDGHPVLAAAEASAGDTISIEFADGRIGARVTDGAASKPVRPAAAPRKREEDGSKGGHGSLL